MSDVAPGVSRVAELKEAQKAVLGAASFAGRGNEAECRRHIEAAQDRLTRVLDSLNEDRDHA